MKHQFLCGAAIRNITPNVENGVLPMPKGFSASTRELTTVHDPLHLRVIALKDATKTVLLVSMDVVNLDAKLYGPALAQHTGVPEEAIFLLETTAHSTIRAGSEGRNSSDPEGQRKLKLYAQLVMEQLLAAADEALASLRPAKIAVGRAESYVNANRYLAYEADVDGKCVRYGGFGTNFAGPSDHTVGVVRFVEENGAPIAFFINYAVFNVVMDDNMAGENGTGAISADLAGYVSTHVEARYPGAVAMWCGGANCDQNPIMGAKSFVPDPDGGGVKVMYLSPSGCHEVWSYLGQINYADTVKAIENAGECRCVSSIAYAKGEISIPGRMGQTELLEESGFAHTKYETGPDKVLHLSVLRIGNAALVFHGGSIFSAIGMAMKEDTVLKDTFIATGFVSALVPFDGVVCDDEALLLGGHDANRAKYRPGFIKSALTSLMNELILQTEDKPYEAETYSAIE